MKCIRITKKIFKKIKKPKKRSHKYQNGLVLIVAGSRQYHGSLVFAAVTASRLVDLVFVCTAKENFSIIKKFSPAFIVQTYANAKKIAEQVDSILIGPGIPHDNAMKKLVTELVSKNRSKKLVLDATALRLLKPKILHSNCVVTPHAKEFSALFKIKPCKENVFKAAKKFNCIVTLKGPVDYISDGKKIYCNYTGNEGMSKGGTGDTLAGLITGFAAKSPLLESTLAAFYLNGYTGNMLKKERSIMFNATDLMEALPFAFKKLAK